ncbi:MAG: energy transducer TonB [Bacteroidia bacterium]|jgi:protein TonB|nr:energy transducer TonB [Bacteroidia bacterium]
MALLFFREQNLDEVVFEQRNKNYGAYAIRKSYPVNITKAVGSTLSLIALIPLISTVGNYFFPSIKPITTIVNSTPVDLTESFELILPKIETSSGSASTATSTSTENTNYRVVANTNATVNQPQIQAGTSETGTSTQSGTGSLATGNSGTTDGNVAATATQPTIELIEEIQPSFNGDIYEYLEKELIYPNLAYQMGITGRVIVLFEINEAGKVVNATVEKGLGYGCDEEAIRVVENMPKWNPGSQNGKNVKVRVKLPITFTLM